MSCTKKVIISIISTTIICCVLGVFLLDYYLQSNTYNEDIIQTTLDSKFMGEEREVIIHLPESYEEDSNKTYPIMYVLDGTSQDGHTFAKTDLLSKINQFPESIVVGIPNTSGNRSRDFTPHYMKIDLDELDSKNGNGNNFLMFIEKELIPFVDTNYRSNTFRTISGNSRGGLFVFYALLEKPGLFNGYICYSPAFWREDVLIAKKAEEFFMENEIKNKFLYMSLGDSENEKMKNGFRIVDTLLSKKYTEGHTDTTLEWHSQITKNANHGSNAYKSTIYALQKLNTYYKKGLATSK